MLREKYKRSVGFSDHTIEDLAAKVAVTQGATIIEKHFKEIVRPIDSYFSMKLSNLKKFKKDLNDIEIILGKKKLILTESAKKNFSGRRSLYIAKKIAKGEKFTLDNLKSVRPGFSLHPKYLKSILGKKSLKNLKAGDRIFKKNIKNIK